MNNCDYHAALSFYKLTELRERVRLDVYAILYVNDSIFLEVIVMGYCSDKMEKLRNLPNPYAWLYITAKVLGGVAIGVLLANWLSTWTWWIFMIIACIVAIPVVWKLFSKLRRCGYPRSFSIITIAGYL